ncbi:MAG TPA: response regulator [Xanthobacteraceae bacterium]
MISIVDDNYEIREATKSLVQSLGLVAKAFPSAVSFLQSPLIAETSCLILDVQMAEMSGIDLQEHLCRLGLEIPTIFITGTPDSAFKKRALNAGAICVLNKPFDLEQPLVDCIQAALDQWKRRIARSSCA